MNTPVMGKQKNRGKRDQMIGMWCEEREYRFIEQAAAKAGLSKGGYCRKVVLGELHQARPAGRGDLINADIRELKDELVKVGNNLNQLVKKVHTFGEVPQQEILQALHADYGKVYTRILKRLG